MVVSKNEGTCQGEKSAGGETMNGATGRYDLPGEGSEGELIQRKMTTSPVKIYGAGEYLFHASQHADCFWMIKSGRVAQYKGETRLNELGPRRFLGMRTFLLEGKFETTAQIVEPSEIVELDLAFLKDFLSRPEAVLAFLREQEQELFRITEAGRRREVMFAALRQRVDTLEDEAKRGGQTGAPSIQGRAERILQLIVPEIKQASVDLDTLARDEPALWRSLQENDTFARLFLAVKNVATHLGSADLSSRSNRQ